MNRKMLGILLLCLGSTTLSISILLLDVEAVLNGRSTSDILTQFPGVLYMAIPLFWTLLGVVLLLIPTRSKCAEDNE